MARSYWGAYSPPFGKHPGIPLDDYCVPEDAHMVSCDMQDFTCKDMPVFGFQYVDIPRHNQLLVECIETLGEEANGPENGWTPEANILVATITGNYYYIDDHDGAGEEVIDISKMIDASE